MVGHDAEYNPAQHELTADTHIDKLVRPGLYSAPISLAGDHLIALGHIVKHSGISRDAGDYVLEYGAGFGQIALTFARLGAVVDTVDIDRTFCEAIKAQAEWFGLPLTPHVGEFGSNPTGKKYKLIVFYEAFHHARNFMELVPTLRSVLAVDRKIMMAGEPIVNTPAGQYSAQLPYPWGIRLDAEVGAIVRLKYWYELGFEEDFLVKFFYRMGFVCRKHDGMISTYATVYEFMARPEVLSLTEWYLAPSDEATWHSLEVEGRWTTERSTIALDQLTSWEALRVVVRNHHPSARLVSFDVGAQPLLEKVKPGKSLQIDLPRAVNGSALNIGCQTLQPRSYGRPDDRNLGIFVPHIEYL